MLKLRFKRLLLYQRCIVSGTIVSDVCRAPDYARRAPETTDHVLTVGVYQGGFCCGRVACVEINRFQLSFCVRIGYCAVTCSVERTPPSASTLGQEAKPSVEDHPIIA